MDMRQSEPVYIIFTLSHARHTDIHVKTKYEHMIQRVLFGYIYLWKLTCWIIAKVQLASSGNKIAGWIPQNRFYIFCIIISLNINFRYHNINWYIILANGRLLVCPNYIRFLSFYVFFFVPYALIFQSLHWKLFVMVKLSCLNVFFIYLLFLTSHEIQSRS